MYGFILKKQSQLGCWRKGYVELARYGYPKRYDESVLMGTRDGPERGLRLNMVGVVDADDGARRDSHSQTSCRWLTSRCLLLYIAADVAATPSSVRRRCHRDLTASGTASALVLSDLEKNRVQAGR